jgi:UDP-glucose 4-epimerase
MTWLQPAPISGPNWAHLVDALLDRGDSVVVLDNLSTGRQANLEHGTAHPNLRFVHGSVLDEPLVDELVNDCDTIVHLAAAVGVKLIIEHPLRSITTNIRGSENVIGAAHRYRRKVLLASTSEIYGKNGSGPLSETADRVLGDPSIARWAYSTAKAVDEMLASAYHQERGLPTVVVRLFNTVGPRQSPNYGMVIPRLISQALAGEPLTVFGDGSQTRCFCHVADVVRALLMLMEQPDAVGQVYNVGSTEEVSIAELARRVLVATGSTSTIDFIPYGEAYGIGFEDMQRRLPDVSKLRALTGWVPRFDLDHILTETVADAAGQRTITASTP